MFSFLYPLEFRFALVKHCRSFDFSHTSNKVAFMLTACVFLLPVSQLVRKIILISRTLAETHDIDTFIPSFVTFNFFETG